MMLISAHSGSEGGVTFVQVRPSSSDRCTRPSSVPAQNTPFFRGDSASAKIVQYTSAPVLSRVTGPPDGFSLSGSLRVRSGLRTSKLEPRSVDLNSTLPAIYSSCGACCENMIGNVHCNRYFRLSAPAPQP